MLQRAVATYYRLTLGRPWWVIALVALALAALATQVPKFRLDASAESLVLEDDQDIRIYRELRLRYGSDDLLLVTFAPDAPLFEQASLARLRALRDELAALPAVGSVTSILDVPLLDSPRVTFTELDAGTRTLLDADTDRELARHEFLTSPLYRDLLLNRDADTTMLLVTLTPDPEAQDLLMRRDGLRVRRDRQELDAEGLRQLEAHEQTYAERNAEWQARLQATIGEVRALLARHGAHARIHLGGVPMIASDMIDFVRDDLRTFGVGVGVFILVLLTVAFRRVRWVLVPALLCAGVALGMTGLLGLLGWPVTVVSSNFISLVLILTLSLVVHLVVRHRELHVATPTASAAELLRGTVDSKIGPSFYTALTTMVAFGSLLLAEIRPVMDFGLMMVCAVGFGFVLTFLLFPAMLARRAPGAPPPARQDLTARFNRAAASLVERRPRAIWIAFAVLLVASVLGIGRLTVENRFIDYFDRSTEIYQGMALIDRELGGTTPLDIVLDAPVEQPDPDAAGFVDEDLDFYDELTEPGPSTGYWFTAEGIATVERVHDYLDGLAETGKVLSLATSLRLLTHLNEGQPLDPFELGVAYRRASESLRAILFDPYLAQDGEQIRFAVRVVDSFPNLQRDALLAKIRADLVRDFDLSPDQVVLSGMLVLYNNVMQSLIGSQVVTMVVVFAAMMLMFGLLYRSLKMAVIGPLPTLVAALAMLGLIGWSGLPLDMMTMTIAAITIGIGVHDTIHYADRFARLVRAGASYRAATAESHAQVGRAMVYTTVIITAGFSILVLSNFMPSIYFGVLTGAAMVFALVANLTLLPLLLQALRPFGGEAAKPNAARAPA